MDNIKDQITKEWIEEQIKLGQTEKNMAKLVSCSISTIQRVKKKFNINSADFDLSGQKFGKWTVLGKGKKKQRLLCECECGTMKEMDTNLLISRQSTQCRGCRHENSYMEITSRWWYRLTQTHYEFDITPEYIWELYLKQDKKCALTGLDIRFPKIGEQSDRDGIVSIDRIDNTKGYIKGNIQLVTIRINLMKHISTQEKFIEMCHLVAKNNQKEFK